MQPTNNSLKQNFLTKIAVSEADIPGTPVRITFFDGSEITTRISRMIYEPPKNDSAGKLTLRIGDNSGKLVIAQEAQGKLVICYTSLHPSACFDQGVGVEVGQAFRRISYPCQSIVSPLIG